MKKLMQSLAILSLVTSLGATPAFAASHRAKRAHHSRVSHRKAKAPRARAAKKAGHRKATPVAKDVTETANE
jgi:hypothetical protein